jgi:hypothetical protein
MLVGPINVCLNETYSRVHIDEHLCDEMLSRHSFSTLLQENKVGLKLSGMHQILLMLIM